MCNYNLDSVEYILQTGTLKSKLEFVKLRYALWSIQYSVSWLNWSLRRHLRSPRTNSGSGCHENLVVYYEAWENILISISTHENHLLLYKSTREIEEWSSSSLICVFEWMLPIAIYPHDPASLMISAILWSQTWLNNKTESKLQFTINHSANDGLLIGLESEENANRETRVVFDHDVKKRNRAMTEISE